MSLNGDIYAILFILLIFPVFCPVTESAYFSPYRVPHSPDKTKDHFRKGLAIL